MTTARLGRGHTRSDLDAMPDDGKRYELLDGEIVNVPAPSGRHQQVSAGLHVLLYNARPSGLTVIAAPLDVELEPGNTVEPDLIVVEPERLGSRGLRGAPLLVVEILSASTRKRDLVEKKRLYERAGVPSYWVVDPEALTLVAWELRNGRYVQVASLATHEQWRATSPFDVTIMPATLLH